MQNDFITGPLGTPEAVAIVNKIKEKIEKKDFEDIIFTRDTHNTDYLQTQEGKKLPIEHCIRRTLGWRIVNPLREAIDKLPFIPHYINKYSFGHWDWDSYLTNVTEIEIIGVCTDICVISNALILKAAFPEIPITVDASCCAGTTPEMHQKALDVMRSCQIEIINENI